MGKGANPYTIKLHPDEREQWEALAKQKGYRTLSKLIRRAMDVVIKQPALLSVIPEIEDYNHLHELTEEVGRQTNNIDERLDILEKSQASILDKINFLISKIATKQEKAQLDQDDEELLFS